MQKELGVLSEAGTLRTVMVCRPGFAHKRLTPSNCNDLLYDDVMWVERAREHHADFVQKMRNRGVDVLDMSDMLQDVVGTEAGRKWILDRKIVDDAVNPIMTADLRDWLDGLESEELVDYLIGGLSLEEVPDEVGGTYKAAVAPDGYMREDWLMPPLPNTQFMRDNSAWIFNGVSVNPMFWPARKQETLLTAAIYKFHPNFANKSFHTWFGDPDKAWNPNTFLEGGDIMPVKPGVLLVGMASAPRSTRPPSWRRPCSRPVPPTASSRPACPRPAPPCTSTRCSRSAPRTSSTPTCRSSTTRGRSRCAPTPSSAAASTFVATAPSWSTR